jgi:CDP-diacylglycerol---glycerol-3-phosphate 3-phosphatidyltransferase
MTTESTAKKPKMTFTDFLRVRFKGILDAIASLLYRLGLRPNMVTLIGLLGNFVAAYFLAIGSITIGGIIVLLMGPVDALDGSLARLSGQTSRFGAFFDSVSDRYSELIVIGGLLVYFARMMTPYGQQGVIVAYLAAAGSVLVSYVKGRGETLGLNTKVGILTRAERYLVMAPLLVIGQPMWALWIIAILANITALQRIWHIRKLAYEADELKS